MHNSPLTHTSTYMYNTCTRTHSTHLTTTHIDIPTTLNTDIELNPLMRVDNQVLWQQNNDAGRSEAQNSSDVKDERWVE